MPTRDKDWARRRGIGPRDRAPNEPWERLRERLMERHGRHVDVARRLERPDPDDLRNLAIFLRQASAAVDADLERLLGGGDHHLTPVELDALRRIADKPSAGVSLAEYLRISPVRVCRILGRLESAGLVLRTETYLDARVRRAEVTEDGRELVAALHVRLLDLARLWLEDIDEGAERALLPLVATLADLT